MRVHLTQLINAEAALTMRLPADLGHELCMLLSIIHTKYHHLYYYYSA